MSSLQLSYSSRDQDRGMQLGNDLSLMLALEYV